MVGKRFDAPQQSWQIQWRCQGKHSLRVLLSWFNGDTVAAERVAGILQERIEAACDRSDRARFSVVLDELVAAELARHTHGGCVDSAAAGFIGSASGTSGGVAVVASDAAAGGVAAAGQSAVGDCSCLLTQTMGVSLRWTNESQRWQLQWNSFGKKRVYVTASSLDGNKTAAERVAMRLKTWIEGASSDENVEPFVVTRDKFVAEELASLHRQAALANSVVNTVGGSTAEEQIRESPLDLGAARVAVVGTMAPKGQGQGGIEKHSTAGTFRAYVKRKGYKGTGPYRAARSAASEDRRILREASVHGTGALRVASQRLLKEVADSRVSRTGLDHVASRGDVAVVASDVAAGGVAAAGQSAGGDATENVYYTPKKSLDPLQVANPLDLPSRSRPSDPDTADNFPLPPFSPFPRPSRPRPSRPRLSAQDPVGPEPPDPDPGRLSKTLRPRLSRLSPSRPRLSGGHFYAGLEAEASLHASWKAICCPEGNRGFAIGS